MSHFESESIKQTESITTFSKGFNKRLTVLEQRLETLYDEAGWMKANEELVKKVELMEKIASSTKREIAHLVEEESWAANKRKQEDQEMAQDLLNLKEQ